MRLRRLDRPVLRDGEVLVQVAWSGICGSELSGFLGQNSLRTPPLVFGHELSGTVAEVGPGVPDGPAGWQPGTRVTVNPLVTCGRCRSCTTGRHQLCPARLLLGASLPGSNAEYVAVPATALEPVPEGLDLRDAALTEPAACAVHAVALSGAGPADSALVVGAGPIGLFLVQVLLTHGVSPVFVTDRNDTRRRRATAMGAVPLGDSEAEVLSGIREHTGADGVTVTADAAGTEVTRRTCLAATAPGGRLLLVGLHTDATTLPLNTLVRNEVTAQGVFAYPPQAFRTALGWLASGRLGLAEGVVDADLADGPQWYERLVDGDPAAKVLLRPAAS